jgi:uncharacterized membrane protein YhiD involved in acid resistance
MPFNFFDLTNTEISAAVVIFNLILALILEVAIAWTYKRTHRGIAYSQSFLFTLVMMGLIVTAIMMVVANNIIGAFALLGAFALIRFRTIVKETRDIAFLFLALAIGVAVGTNNYAVAIIVTIFIGTLILVLHRINFGSLVRRGFILTFLAGHGHDEKNLEPIFNEFLTECRLLHIKGFKEGEREFAYIIKPKDEQRLNTFINSLETLPNLSQPSIITGHETSEY